MSDFSIPHGDQASDVDRYDKLPSQGASASALGASGRLLLSLGVDPDSVASAARSIDALVAAFRSLDGAANVFADLAPELFDVDAESGAYLSFGDGDGLFALRFSVAALRASNLTIRFDPSQRYLELVAAVAKQLDRNVVTVHGWPILSVDGGHSTVGEAAGESISGSRASEGEAE